MRDSENFICKGRIGRKGLFRRGDIITYIQTNILTYLQTCRRAFIHTYAHARPNDHIP